MKETEYLQTLKAEKLLYAWCLSNMGNFTEEEAAFESDKHNNTKHGSLGLWNI